MSCLDSCKADLRAIKALCLSDAGRSEAESKASLADFATCSADSDSILVGVDLTSLERRAVESRRLIFWILRPKLFPLLFENEVTDWHLYVPSVSRGVITRMTPHPLRLSAESIASSLLSDRTHSPPLHPIPELDNVDTEEQVVTPALLQILFVSSLGGLLFGFDTGVVSGALLVIGTDLGGSPLSSFQESWLVSSALLAALVGSLVAGRLADWWGRKPVILLGAVGFALGALEQAAASVFKEVVLGRVLVGLAVGLASTVLPAYLAELSPPKFRGRAVAGLVCLITGGMFHWFLAPCFLNNLTGFDAPNRTGSFLRD